MKYRMLTNEELEIFNEDFKHFAIANGVDNDSWIKLNEEEPEKAKQLVEIFSDTVLQKVYERIKFIEHRSKNACLVFKLNPENIELISINAKNESVDLSTPESIHQALVNQSNDLTFFESIKNYSKIRELEIHEMIESGCLNSNESFWILLKRSIKSD